jgi:Fe-S oxidoreductase
MEQDELRAFEKKCIQEELAYCAAACPFHVDIKAFLGHMAKKEVDKAFKIIERSLPLPEILGRICDHPCENQCIRKDLDASISIGLLERACVTSPHKEKKRFLPPARGKRVGIWGSGLSSLIVAWDLGLKGYGVTVFDQAPVFGGNLRNLSSSVLPDSLLVQEIKQLESFGVKFKGGVSLDTTLLEELTHSFDALYLGCDAPVDPYPGIVYDSTGRPEVDSFLRQTSDPKIFAGGFSDPAGSDPCGAVNPESYPMAHAAQGRKAATSIDRVLARVSVTAGREKEGACETRLTTDTSRIHVQLPIDFRCDPTDPAVGYDLEKAGKEALRCIQCDCSRCVRVCTYIESFKGFPGRYAREIYNNAAIVMGDKKANLLINSCSLCSLCETVCPHGFSMADLCLSARQEMVAAGKMPVSAHEFALQEMAHATGDACFFARHAPGAKSSARIFFPGCQLLGSAPDQVARVYDFLRNYLPGPIGFVSGCCGAPGVWAGQAALATEALVPFKNFWEASGRPPVITACTSCTQMLTQALEGVKITSLFQLMVTQPLLGRLKEMTRQSPCLFDPVSIIDPCTARADGVVQAAVRTLVQSAGMKVIELPAAGELTECCGFGGLVFNANPDLSKRIIGQRSAQSDNDFLAYCAMCRDRLASTGKKVAHVLDLFWPSTDHPKDRDDPGFSRRHDNLARARQEMLATVWKETGSQKQGAKQQPLIISPEVAKVLDDRFILASDIQGVMAQFESGGDHFFCPENNSLICFYRPVRVCFWVEFRKKSSGYEILNGWSHRMKVVANHQFEPGILTPGTESPGADPPVLCHACNEILTPCKNHVEYLSSRFDVAMLQCPGCGIVYVSQALARGKMAEVEKILEDK